MKRLQELLSPDEILTSKVPPSRVMTGLTANSRGVQEGNLFFAIAGHQSDGHQFVAEILRQGALAVVEKPEIYAEFPNTILVDSTRRLLGEAAARWYDDPSHVFKLVGVTGTNGKTTTTFLLKNIWDALGVTSGIVGTVEYHIGNKRRPSPLTTPDALTLQALFAEMVQARVSRVALEVSSIALDQHRVAGSRFDIAIFTNFTQDHLDYHGSMERYLDAKRRLFVGHKPRLAIFNTDDPAGRHLYDGHVGEKLRFSLEDPTADFTALDAVYGKSTTEARVLTPQGSFLFRTPLIGKHNLYNCLGAMAAAFSMGHEAKDVVTALAAAGGAPGRLERVVGEPGKHPHVFVDYAHSDDALKNVLASLHELRTGGTGRIVTVFGCGGDRDRGKRPLMARVASQYSDITIATSDNPRTEDPDRILDDVEKGVERSRTEYYRERDRAAAIALALRLARPEDLVLVAGKGHETYQILGREKVPFDDREVVRRCFVDR